MLHNACFFFFFFLLLTLFVHSQSQNENTAAPKPPLFHKEDEDEIGPEFGKSRKWLCNQLCGLGDYSGRLQTPSRSARALVLHTWVQCCCWKRPMDPPALYGPEFKEDLLCFSVFPLNFSVLYSLSVHVNTLQSNKKLKVLTRGNNSHTQKPLFSQLPAMEF